MDKYILLSHKQMKMFTVDKLIFLRQIKIEKKKLIKK